MDPTKMDYLLSYGLIKWGEKLLELDETTKKVLLRPCLGGGSNASG
jgi:hypothetical protein